MILSGTCFPEPVIFPQLQANPMPFDLLLTNGAIMPPSPGKAGIASGYIGIRAGRIAAMGSMSELPSTACGLHIDASGCLILPGLVNAHTHAAMTLFRGLADDLPLMTWLQEHIFPAEARSVNEEMVYWSAKLAAAEMLLAGTTCVADSYFHEDAAAEAFCEAGLRAVAGQGIIDFPAPGVPDPSKNIDAAARFVEKWQGRNPLLTPAVFCHSPYTCGPETLRQAKTMANARGVPFFIHVAETKDELDIMQARYGRTPVTHLAELGILDRQTICVHCIWLTGTDVDLLAEAESGIVICPASHMKLASGIAPLRDLLARRLPVGLGTDGCASNNTLDMFREMDLCAKLQKASHLTPTAVSAGGVLALATRGGASLLGLGKQVGILAPGWEADLMVLDLASPHLTPCYHADSQLVYAARGADVRDVVIAGRLVMRERRILTFDVGEAMTRVRKLALAVKAGI
jgi:5-methylthioadenosine/S-adenosylhomocysteine deaminase